MTLASLKIHLRGSKRRRRRRREEEGVGASLFLLSKAFFGARRRTNETGKRRKTLFPLPPSVLISVFSSLCGFFSYDASATEGEKRKRKKKKRGGEATSKEEEEEEVGGKAAAMRRTINHPSAQAKGSFSHRLANSPSSCSWWWWSRERERKDIRGLLARSLENHLRPLVPPFSLPLVLSILGIHWP